MSEVHVFTSAALNYIPKVRLLFQSLRTHHPEWRLHLALVDERPSQFDLSQEPCDEVHAIGDLGIAAWRGWAFCHSIVELATAIKPFVLQRLLGLPLAGKVLYLDPDIVIFSRLDDIIEALDNASILLTPHQTTPETSLGAVMDNEICSLRHGIYNLGFIGVSASHIGHGFADWWGQRLYHFCRKDIAQGLFTDQRWIDLVPAFFSEVAIMRSPRHNVASWNLSSRDLRLAAPGDYRIGDERLGFYHFTGFDSGSHRLMVMKSAGNNAAAQRLVRWYAGEMALAARDPLARQPWSFGSFSDGTPITPAQRIVYRERPDLQEKFPDPFDASAYLAWWRVRASRDYPELFKGGTTDQAIAKYFSVLTPGFGGRQSGPAWHHLLSLARHALTQPGMGSALSRRGWEILKNEGLGGIRRRVQP